MTDYTANSGSSLTTLFANRSSSDPSLNYLTGYENTAGVDFSDLFLPLLPWNTAISNTNYEYNGNDLATLFNPANTPTLPFVIDITSTTGGWTYFYGDAVNGLESSFTIVIADYENIPPETPPRPGRNTVDAKMTFPNPENIQNFNAIIVGGGGDGYNNGQVDQNTGGGGQGGYGGQLAVSPLSKLNLDGDNFNSSSYITITVGGPATTSSVSIVFASGNGYYTNGSAGAGGSNNGTGGSGGGSEVVTFTGNPTMITDVWGGANGQDGINGPQVGNPGWNPTIAHFTAGTNITVNTSFGGGGGAGVSDEPPYSKPGGKGGGGGYGGTYGNWPNDQGNNYNTTNNTVNGIYYPQTGPPNSTGLNGTGGGGAGVNQYIVDQYGNSMNLAGSGIVIFQFQVAGWTPPPNFPTTGSGGPG
jgi:hypothetical protein